MKDEIGRELKASELKVGTVVVVKPPGDKPFISVWVSEVGPKLVIFYAGKMHWHIINFVQDDGSILDDQQRRVHVYEYLGEV